MIRVLIVDDHILFREGVALILRADPEIQIVGTGGSVREAVELAARHKPDVTLMDFSLPDGTGLEATAQILSFAPDSKIVFLTVSGEDERLFSALRAGASGYLLKNVSPDRLVAALRAVLNGEIALSRAMTTRLIEEFRRTPPLAPAAAPDSAAAPAPAPAGEKMEAGPIARLTQRELDVLRELSRGFSNQEIAGHLCLSLNTVKFHVHSILEKLGVDDRGAAAQYARGHGLLRTVFNDAAERG
jgi:two-component system NarL family response regulator